MENNKKQSASFEIITPEIAREYLKSNVVNRPLNKKNVDFYAEQIKKGQWRANGEAICFTQDGAMANGQHRLNAIIQAGIPVTVLVARGCDNDSFITYDSGRNRGVADVFALSDIKDYVSISASISSYFKCHFGLQSITNNKNTGASVKSDKKVSKADYLDEYNSSPELYYNANLFANQCYKKIKLLKKSEIAGLIVFLHKDKHYPIEFIESFFRMMFFNEKVSNNTISVFREKVIQDGLGNTKMTSTYKNQLFIKTWNAYVCNKEIKVLSWNESKEGKLNYK